MNDSREVPAGARVFCLTPEQCIPLLLDPAMLALLVLVALLAPPMPAASLLLEGRRLLGCKASSSGVSSTTPLPFTLLTSGRSLGALRLELAQPTCFKRVCSFTGPYGHVGAALKNKQKGSCMPLQMSFIRLMGVTDHLPSGHPGCWRMLSWSQKPSSQRSSSRPQEYPASSSPAVHLLVVVQQK